MKKVIVCGSIAYDNIMEFPGQFKEHILPDRIDTLSVSFVVNTFKKSRGGTAPNIAYNLSLLGQKPIICGTAGKDFIDYKNWLDKQGVDTNYIRILEDDYTASCYIITDETNNQITGFYPGAMTRDIEFSLKDLNLEDIAMVIIAPADPKSIINWALECKEMGMPYIFDPGMSMPRLSGEDLIKGIMGATIVIVNEYEYPLMLEKTGLSREEILSNVDLLIQTLGERGSILQTKDERVVVPAAKPISVVDPTGAGDAYKAGLLKGYFEGVSLEQMGMYGSVAAVYAVEQKGGTEHRYTIDDFMQRCDNNYEVSVKVG